MVLGLLFHSVAYAQFIEQEEMIKLAEDFIMKIQSLKPRPVNKSVYSGGDVDYYYSIPYAMMINNSEMAFKMPQAVGGEYKRVE